MTNTPKVSVIIPIYNRSHLIHKSINSALNQTYKNIELIIVDDSDDDTETKVKKIKDEKMIYIKNKQTMGVLKARNMGVEISTGELMAFQDSDDEWIEEKLEKQVNLLSQSPEDVAAVYYGMEFIGNQTGQIIGDSIKKINFRENFTKGSFFLLHLIKQF